MATPHIGGSTEEAQEIVGIRIVEQLVEYLKNGVAINAVNMPALSPEQYKSVGPFIALAERLGQLAAHVATGHPKSVRLTYRGRFAQASTALLRNAGIAGVLIRSVERKPNLVNAMELASRRGLGISEVHEQRAAHIDSILLELETDTGVTRVEGALVLDRPRLLQMDGIYCEAPLEGNLTVMKNLDVPGVIGHVGTVLGAAGINIANFSLGRCGDQAIAVVETDSPVIEPVLAQLKANRAVRAAKAVQFV